MSTLVGCREVLLKEAVKLREEGCGDSQMEMGGGVVGIGKFQREKRTWMGEPGVYRYCGDTEGLKRVP